MKTTATKQLLAVVGKVQRQRRRAQGTTLPAPAVVFVPIGANVESFTTRPDVIYFPEAFRPVWAALSGDKAIGDLSQLRELVRVVSTRGGRGSAKTYSILLAIAALACWSWNGGSVRSTMCLRAVQASLDDSSRDELRRIIQRQGWASQFELLGDKVFRSWAGARIVFKGLSKDSTGTGAQRLKSLSSVFDLAFVEEAAEVLQVNDFDLLLPSLRGKGAQVITAHNPKSRLNAIELWAGEDSAFPLANLENVAQTSAGALLRVVMNYTDNPWFASSVLYADMVNDQGRPIFEHKWLGMFETVGGGIIKLKHLEACVDLALLFADDWEPDENELRFGYDPADADHDRADFHGLAYACAETIMSLFELRFPDVVAASKEVYRRASTMEAREIYFDAGGVGAGARGGFNSIHRLIEATDGHVFEAVPVRAILFGQAVDNPEQQAATSKVRNKNLWRNWKAQQMQYLAMRAENGYQLRKYYDEAIADGLSVEDAREYAIQHIGDRLDFILNLNSFSIDPIALKRFFAEAVEPRWVETEGPRQVESKRDLKKRGIASTNLLDAVLLVMNAPNKRRNYATEA